jgi:hypothetical protein
MSSFSRVHCKGTATLTARSKASADSNGTGASRSSPQSEHLYMTRIVGVCITRLYSLSLATAPILPMAAGPVPNGICMRTSLAFVISLTVACSDASTNLTDDASAPGDVDALTNDDTGAELGGSGGSSLDASPAGTGGRWSGSGPGGSSGTGGAMGTGGSGGAPMQGSGGAGGMATGTGGTSGGYPACAVPAGARVQSQYCSVLTSTGTRALRRGPYLCLRDCVSISSAGLPIAGYGGTYGPECVTPNGGLCVSSCGTCMAPTD